MHKHYYIPLNWSLSHHTCFIAYLAVVGIAKLQTLSAKVSIAKFKLLIGLERIHIIWKYLCAWNWCNKGCTHLKNLIHWYKQCDLFLVYYFMHYVCRMLPLLAKSPNIRLVLFNEESLTMHLWLYNLQCWFMCKSVLMHQCFKMVRNLRIIRVASTLNNDTFLTKSCIRCQSQIVYVKDTHELSTTSDTICV